MVDIMDPLDSRVRPDAGPAFPVSAPAVHVLIRVNKFFRYDEIRA